MIGPSVPPSQDLDANRAYTFGPYRLLKTAKQLLKDGVPVRLGSRALNLLVALVERPGQILSRAELEAQVWPSTIVEETSLRVHIAALRKALDEGAGSSRYITNVPGRGYCFVAPVDIALENPGPMGAITCAADRALNNLPARLTGVIGRQEVITALGQHLARRRLVSIVGPGGIGKTTVALAVAAGQVAAYRHGTVFVDLAPLTDPELVPSALAFALGYQAPTQFPLPELCAFLRDRSLLVVLDNCEHVVSAAAGLVESIMRAAPGVHILATTREPLFAEGEWVHRLSALEAPGMTEELTNEQSMAYSAVRLFVERAEANADGFALSGQTLPAVLQLCQRLDGIPLAIELAAARVSSLGVLGLAQRLDELFQLLGRGRRTAMPRHQTLEALLDWSYDLLNHAEQLVLQRLSVFRASFTLEWAAAVAASEDLPAPLVIASVLSLAVKSLVRVEATGSVAQYRLLYMTRAYAARKLGEGDDLHATQRRHAQHFLVLAEATGSQKSGGVPAAETTAAYSRLIDDFRTALDWTFSNDGDDEIGVSLTVAVWIPVCGLGLVSEYRARVERGLERVTRLSPPQPLLELRLCVAWCFLSGQSPGISRDTQGEIFSRALKLAEQSSDVERHAEVLYSICVGSLGQGRYDVVANLAQRIQALVAGPSRPLSVLVGDRMMTLAQHHLGHHGAARALMKKVIEFPVEPRHSWFVGQVPRTVSMGIVEARILWLEGHGDQAADAARRAVERAIGEHPFALAQALALGAAPISLWRGDLVQAADWTRALHDHAIRHALAFWQSWATSYQQVLALRDAARPVTAATRRSWVVTNNPSELDMLATQAASFLTPGTVARMNDGHVAWCGPEILRVAGENLLQAHGADAHAEAAALFTRGLRMAREQGALAWELRLATSQAALWRSQGRLQAAHDLLAGVAGRFSEGLGTGDLQQANQLLGQLRDTRVA